MSTLNVGFIGLGIMGAPMCGHLINAGHNVFVTTRSKVPEAIAQSKAVQCASAQEVAQKADLIITMLPDTPDVERCCLVIAVWPAAYQRGRSSST